MASIPAADGYGLFHEGPGTPSLDDAAHAGQELMSRYNDRMNQVSGLVQGISGSWSGSAADAAQAGALPLVRSLQQSHDALTTAQDLMARQSGSFHDGARSVQRMPDQPPQPSIGDFLPPWSNSYQDKVNTYIGQAQANVTAMHNYGAATNYNRGSTPDSYGGVTGGGSDITIAPDQGTSGGSGSQPGTGGGTHYQSHATGGGGYTPGGVSGGGPGANSNYMTSPGGGQPGSGGYGGPGSSTSQQGWQDGGPGQGPGYGAPGYGQPGGGSSFGPGGIGGFGPVGGGFGGGADGGYGGGSGRGGVGGGAGARGFSSGAGTQGGNQPGAGSRAGAGGVPGEASPGAAAAAGRAGAAGASGASGMGAGAGGRGGRKDEDLEHKSASYLEDDYSDDIVGELPRTVPPVIGLD